MSDSVVVRTSIDAHFAEAIRILAPGMTRSGFAQEAITEKIHRMARQREDITKLAGAQAPLPEPQPLPLMPPAWGMTEEDFA